MPIYNFTWNPVPGSEGYLIEYRIVDSGTWITPNTTPNPTLNTNYSLSLTANTFYDVRISSDGGDNCSKKYTYYSLHTAAGVCCPATYTLSPDSSYCYKLQTTSPTILQSNICLAPSQLANTYTKYGTRIYNPGYTTALAGTYTDIFTVTQWKDSLPFGVAGPMNRNGIWVDTDCNGSKDPLTIGQILQITVKVTSAIAKTLYVGIAGDNTFRLDVNGVTVVDRNSTYGTINFDVWHVIPVNIISGDNYFTFSAAGDGSVNDSFAAVIYNNTQTQLAAATTDVELDIIFQTQDYIGYHIDIATCPTNYFLDTSAGSGSYICRRVLTTATVSC